MSHETREGKKIGEELHHGHFNEAHKEISHELHAHPKEFENTLKSINKDLAKHHENPLSVERDGKNQISHINFNNHDIYSSSKAGADKPASGEPHRKADSAPDHSRNGQRPEAESRQGREGREGREEHEGRRHHEKHHGKKHGRHHHHGGGGDSDSADSEDSKDPKDAASPNDGDPKGKPGDPKDPAKDAAGNPKDPAAAGADSKITTPDADGLRGRDNSEKAMNYFQDKGLTKAQAAGIVGNFDREAPGVDPSMHQERGGPGYGIAQWEGSRKKGEREFAKEQGKPADDLKTQLDYAWKELNTTHRGALAAVERSRTPGQAARAFERGFEAAGKPHMASRERSAMYAFNRPSDSDDSGVLAASR